MTGFYEFASIYIYIYLCTYEVLVHFLLLFVAAVGVEVYRFGIGEGGAGYVGAHAVCLW